MKWYSKYLEVYGKTADRIDPAVFEDIREHMAKLQSDDPIATVAVRAYNEEPRLTACLWSLSRLRTTYPIRIIGVDNVSTDRSAEIFEKCGVPCYTETEHSCGASWDCALRNVRGKYHINIDGDSIYPPLYAQEMIKHLEKEGVVAVDSFWSYFPDENHSAFSLFFYELIRDVYLWLLHFNRPELAVRGIAFAYDAGLGRKVGIRKDIKRGEDGSLTLGLKQYGKVRFLCGRKARPVTGYGTLGQDKSVTQLLATRFRQRIKTIPQLFTRQEKYQDRDENLVKK